MAKAAVKAAAKAAPKAKAGAKPAVKAATVTLKHIGAALAEAHSMPKKQANEVLADMVHMIAGHLKKGARSTGALFLIARSTEPERLPARRTVCKARRPLARAPRNANPRINHGPKPERRHSDPLHPTSG